MKAFIQSLILSLCLPLIAVSARSVHTQDVKMSVVPDPVYKLKDGGRMPTESFMFFVVINDARNRDGIKAIESRADLISAGSIVQTTVLKTDALARLRLKTFTVPKDAPAHSLRRAYAREELFDIPYIFPQIPSAWNIDKVRIALRFEIPGEPESQMSIEVPVGVYQQKTQFMFPIRGTGMITQGMWNNGGHSGYGNQFAFDLNGLTPNYSAMLKDSEELTAYATWGREVLAPADGQVVSVRNDIPDNGPGVNPEDVFAKLPEPMLATAGNTVVLSHGNSEYSVVMHLQKGSVRVTKGQTVKRGDVIGLIGNSGDSFGPHLHFQVQKGPELFRHPSVPVTFENLKNVALLRGVFFDAKS